MPVTTASAAFHIAPVVIKTFFKHGKRKAIRLKDSKHGKEVPQDDIFFDQAFHIVKAFIAMGTKNTIESLQGFTNTHVPAPYWAAVSPVVIPLSTCNDAADHLIKWFGSEELKYVVGGERWWQVRGLSGIDGEWIAELEHLDSETPVQAKGEKKLSASDANILRMEKLETVMLYIHGGGYFWGSVNTHRYQILHYARKFKGRAFAVNYRKAPQYPWPCPVQDVIAAYLYLIQPPSGTLHKAIPSSKIVFAGDSAGGGLCISVLTVLRDLGLPMPAGAVLISPWVDLTHSFPSIMENYDTDIIPKHGFIAKPSTLWPLPTEPENGGRIVPTVTNDPPTPGKADTLLPPPNRVGKCDQQSSVYGPGEVVKNQEDMLNTANTPSSDGEKGNPPDMSTNTPSSSGTKTASNMDETQEALDAHGIKYWEPKPPKVLMKDPSATPLELRSQIQMYATTEQLTHPLVSPILQASLGNLPPLYIIAGDGEVLRDEIVYLAHKAAHPSEYPTRSGVLNDSARQKENLQKFSRPTKVHLQVFDGMCHVLTVFMFTKSSKYAYRSIAEFVKHVTTHSEEDLEKTPFPELHKPLTELSRDMDSENGLVKPSQSEKPAPNAIEKSDLPSDVKVYMENKEILATDSEKANVESLSSVSSSGEGHPSTEASQEDNVIVKPLMIRQRVNLYGHIRSMEPVEDMAALNLKNSQIGIIKEAPALRWKDGQDVWDKRYAKDSKRVLKQKAKNEAKATRLLVHAIDQGFLHQSQACLKTAENRTNNPSMTASSSIGNIQADRRWGPLDLDAENPPASAIAGRRDTPEAVALLKKSIYHTAPVTHLTVPTLKMRDAVRAAFNPYDDPNRPPQQSVSEQQVRTHLVPFHGLRVWDSIVRYFGRKSSAKVVDGINATAEKIGLKDNEGAPGN